MKVSKLIKAICALGVVSVCFGALVSCSGQGSEDQSKGLTGGVAATVNGTEIQEDTITTYIQTVRENSELTDQDAWGQWLVDNDFTPEKIRENVISNFVAQELIKQAAVEKGLEVSSSDVDAYVNQQKAKYASDDEWSQALEKAGITEDEYRSSVETGMTQQKLQDDVVAEEPSNEEILEYAQMYASTYDGAKKSSHILFAADDEAKAQEVLDKLNAGELDFAAAAAEYSTDSSAADGGNVGWDKTSSFVAEYAEALNGLEAGQISGLVKSQFGIHIIKCTEVFTAPEQVTDINQIPTEFSSMIVSSLESSKKSEAYSNWMQAYEESADTVINDMPENVPYNVDMSKYTKTGGDEGAGGMDGATDEGVIIDDATGEEIPTEDMTGTDDTATDDAVTDGDASADDAATNMGDESANASEQPAEAA